VGVWVDVGVDVGAGVAVAVGVGVFDGRGDSVAVGGRVAKATVVAAVVLVGSGGNVDTLSGVWLLLQATSKNNPNVNASNRFTALKSWPVSF